MRHSLAALVALGLLTAATACGGGDADKADPSPTNETSSTPSSPTTSASSEPLACDDLLSAEDVRTLAQRDLGAAQSGDAGGIEACRWGTSAYGVQAIQVPADQWATQLPNLIQQYESSGAEITPKAKRKLDRGLALVNSDKGVSADDACSLFSTLIELQGLPPGSHQVTNLIPDQTKPQAVSSQSCLDGTYSSVTLISGVVLKDAGAVVKRAGVALAALQG